MARLKAFDPDEALERAMELFWRDGYDGTSLSALLEHMGISRQSLYDTFGDKRSLYLAALDRYEVAFAELLERHLADDPGHLALTAFFQSFLATFIHPEERGACMMAAAAIDLGHRDEAVAARVKAHFGALETGLVAALTNVQRRGELAAGADPASGARVLVAVLSGLGAMRRAGASRTALRRTVEGAMTALVHAAT